MSLKIKIKEKDIEAFFERMAESDPNLKKGKDGKFKVVRRKKSGCYFFNGKTNKMYKL